MPRTYDFVWVDVFAARPLEGNQLAVFPDARGISDERMQAIARETHLSETTFVFPSEKDEDERAGYRTRIFAVAGEMPFAGHPTLGTAFVLAEQRKLAEVALRLKVGRIPVTFTDRGDGRFGEMVQNDPVVGTTHDRAAVAKALGVTAGDLDPQLPIQTISTGVPFAIVPFRELSVLARIRPSWTEAETYLRGTDASFFYLVCRETVDRAATLHARMLFAGGEDPATGSAAGPATAWLLLHGLTPPGEPVLIEQGLEAGRPSRLHGRAVLRDGRPTDVRIGGYCAPVIRGQLTI
jgi:trans-2,3-dihydro-3-hydroxyanthranilate isomerase